MRGARKIARFRHNPRESPAILSITGDGSIRDGRFQIKVSSQQVEEMKMENNSRNRSLVVVAVLAGLALLMTLVLCDTATIQAAMKQKAIKKVAQSGNAVAGSDAIAYVTSAPYRDGLFQGEACARTWRTGARLRRPLVFATRS